MIQFQSTAGMVLALFAISDTCATQPQLDLRPIQHRFVEMSVGAERLHIRNAVQWQSFWGRFAATSAPDIDFSKNDVIVVLMGNQGNSGFSIRILDVDSKPHGTRIRVLDCRPSRWPLGSEETSYLAVITSPYDVKLIPKLTTPIKWVTIKGQTGKTPCR